MKKNTNYILVLVMVVILAGCGAAGYYFAYASIREKNEHAATVREAAARILEKEHKETSLQNVLLSTQADREKIDSYVLSDDKIVEFIDLVESLGPVSGSKVTIASVNADEGTGAAKAASARLKLQINAAGSWSNVLTFVSLLENMPYKVAVSSVALTSSDVTVFEKATTTLREWQANVELSVVKTQK